MSWLVVVNLVACFKVTRRPSCEEIGRTELADDERTELGTVQEILDHLTLDGEVSAMGWGGEAVAADLRMERAGAGVWVELQYTEIETRGLGVGGVRYDLGVDCSPSIHVPLELSLEADEVNVELPGAVHQTYPAELGSPLYFDGAYRSDHFPIVDRDPDDYVDKQSGVSFHFQDGELTDGVAGWSGILDTEERNQWASEILLEFGGEP